MNFIHRAMNFIHHVKTALLYAKQCKITSRDNGVTSRNELHTLRNYRIASREARRGSAGIRNLYSYVTSSGDIRYDNRSYAAIVQRKSRVRGQISAPSIPSCVCANELSFKKCVFQVVKSPQSRQTAVTATVVM